MLSVIIKICSYMLLGVMILVSIMLLVPLTSVGQQLYQPVIIKSGSMEPALPMGSLVVIQSSDEYLVGDVIAFKYQTATGEQLVIHRIHKVSPNLEEKSYVTKGDANQNYEPEVVLNSAVLGKVTVLIPHVGWWLAQLKNGYGILAAIFIPAAIFLVESFARRK